MTKLSCWLLKPLFLRSYLSLTDLTRYSNPLLSSLLLRDPKAFWFREILGYVSHRHLKLHRFGFWQHKSLKQSSNNTTLSQQRTNIFVHVFQVERGADGAEEAEADDGQASAAEQGQRAVGEEQNVQIRRCAQVSLPI